MVDRPPIDATRRPQPGLAQQGMGGAEEKNVVQDVDKVLTDAVEAGATDIHFEPLQDSLNVRMRVGGSMKQVRDFPDKLRTNVLNRLKVLSGMDITKSRIPQSGFLRKEMGERKIELYVHVMPSLYGETVVVKLQYKQSATLRLAELGLDWTVALDKQGYFVGRRALEREQRAHRVVARRDRAGSLGDGQGADIRIQARVFEPHAGRMRGIGGEAINTSLGEFIHDARILTCKTGHHRRPQAQPGDGVRCVIDRPAIHVPCP